MELDKAVGWIALAGVAGLFAGALVVWIRMTLSFRSRLQAARKQSVNISRSTLKGQISEQLAPLLPGFAYPASDARFLGDPIDYIVFNGYTHLRDSDDSAADELEVVILDIKYGSSKLTACQRAVAQAVQAGRVRFEVVRIHESGEVETESFAKSRRATR